MLTVDLFADVVCPWCFIGARRLDQVLAELKLDATVVHHPFELDPTTPAGGVNLAERLRAKYGAEPKSMFGRVEAAAQDAGIALDFSKSPQSSYPTIKAHTLLRHAAPRGTQHALADELYQAYFLRGQNIGDDDTLVSLAQRHGFAADEALALLRDQGELRQTRDEAKEASAQGISGVPFFIFNRRLALSGAQPAHVFKAAIERALG